MAEAIISRFGGGDGAEISNETKIALGLDNNATLDDCLKIVALQDPNYATMLVSLKYPDGSAVVGEQIQMIDVGGGNLVYTTDGAGQCLFKTANQSANFIDYNCVYFDLNPAETQLVDCPVGVVKPVILTRTTKGNGYNVKITSNRNIKFSPMLNTIDIYVTSASGEGGFGYNGWSNINHKSSTGNSNYNTSKLGGTGGGANTNTLFGYQVIANTNYEINLGLAGNGKRIISNRYFSGYGNSYNSAFNNAASWHNTNIRILFEISTLRPLFFSTIGTLCHYIPKKRYSYGANSRSA